MDTRRKFIKQAGIAVIAGMVLPPLSKASAGDGVIMTVTGALSPLDLRFTLTHEHILVDFVGAGQQVKSRYDEDEVFKAALPFLLEIKKSGCHSFIDCTPAYLGRDVNLLKRLSEASGINIVTNTGYYGAVNEKYLPAHVYTETAEQLASRWIAEWKKGIEGTDIKPGFIKTGVDKAPLTQAQRKIIRAAALTHLQTGLSIAVHTGDGVAAREQLKILREAGVSPSARIWVHAQNEPDKAFHIEAAKEGSWVSFDGVNDKSLNSHVSYLKTMRSKGLLGSVLVSQDSGWYHVGERDGGNFKSFNFIFTDFIPALKKKGFSQQEIDTIFVKNPSRAFAIGVRKRD